MLKKFAAKFRAKPTEQPPVDASAAAKAAPQRSRDDLHHYWRNADDEYNAPEGYTGKEDESVGRRSDFLVELISRHLEPSARILELGCNVGRNLHYLHSAGFTQIAGVEINQAALDLLHATYPDTAGRAALHAGTIEENLPQFSDQEFDLVFTMAVLEHVHKDSEFIFAEMARVGRMVITIEDERFLSERHFPRNYGPIFESLGLAQLSETQLNKDDHGLGPAFRARVFGRLG